MSYRIVALFQTAARPVADALGPAHPLALVLAATGGRDEVESLLDVAAGHGGTPATLEHPPWTAGG